MGKGSQPATTTQISKVELPQWVEDAGKSNYEFAQQIAAKPLQQFGGPTVADTSPATKQAWDTMQSGAGAGAPDYNAASTAFGGVLASSPSQIMADKVAAGALSDVDLSKYINPYTNEVENKALAALDKSRTQSLMSNADRAVASKAFGGSRSAIVDAVTNAETADKAGQLSAGLRKQGYDTATSLATADLNRAMQSTLANQGANLTAAQANQNAGMQSTAQKIAAGQGLLSAGDAKTRQVMQDFMGLSQAGAQQQGQQQAQIDAEKSKFDEAKNYDLERLNVLLSSLGMTPYGKTTSATGTATPAKSGFDPAQFGMGLLSMMGGLFSSDRNNKTDIKKIGKDTMTGLDMYEYRYKDDPKTYPKVVGPMAQDIEKQMPGAVRKIGKRKVVKMRAMMG